MANIRQKHNVIRTKSGPPQRYSKYQDCYYNELLCANCMILTPGGGHGDQDADAGAAGTVTKDGHLTRVSPEGGDVLLHPAQGSDLVQQAIVPSQVLLPRCQET